MYEAPLLKKIFQVLNLILEEKEPLTLSEIARKTKVNKSTIFGILRSLEKENYVKRNEKTKKYEISRGLVDFAKKVLRKGDLIEIARPFLERLLKLFDETVFLGVKENEHIKILEVLEPQKELKITSPIGTRLSIMAGATGKVVLSFMKEEQVREIIRKKGLKKYTENTICDEEKFIEEIRKVRRQGYGTDFEEYMKGVWACASPILLDDELLGLVWIVGFTSLLEKEKIPSIIEELKNTAQMIALSHRTWK